MKIVIIGSTQYEERIITWAEMERARGNEVKVPSFDDIEEFDELGICKYNRKLIKWADEVHIIWDQRSTGTIFDFGMCFALEKPIKLVYLEQKTFTGVMKKYEKEVK